MLMLQKYIAVSVFCPVLHNNAHLHDIHIIIIIFLQLCKKS